MLSSEYDRLAQRSFHYLRQTMATPYRIALGPYDTGNILRKAYDQVVAAKTSELLQQNLETFDIIFRGARHSKSFAILRANLQISRTGADNRYQDHIVHFLLTLYALGATQGEIEKAYDREAAYQRRRFPIDENVVKAMADKTTFRTYLGQQSQYSNFLLFFQREIETTGVKKTLERHLFADTEHAARLLPRMFTSEWN